ncbi:TatD family hydrolase [Heyndrickxia sp. NPDC080065]|uniref:TatD family hydrolase n=1 Tax=Heyndrickxia sp. NPDC080065 TaxID=3390568 RepID=UPI003D07B46E
MYSSIIDAHIHLDLYNDDERKSILREMEKHKVEALISVSQHLTSAEANMALHQEDKRIKPAFGFHPEQALPDEQELADLQHFIEKHQKEMIAVGEVGLPYYLRQEHKEVPIEPYIEILEFFIQQAVSLKKPIVLHAVYEDAPIVCDLLEKYSYAKAHFHWFKGDQITIEQMSRNGYFISITPDVLYEKEIQQLVNQYPLSQIMVETDGPWPFEGPFQNNMTHPKMIHQTIEQIASIKGMALQEVYSILYENTKRFYSI